MKKDEQNEVLNGEIFLTLTYLLIRVSKQVMKHKQAHFV